MGTARFELSVDFLETSSVGATVLGQLQLCLVGYVEETPRSCPVYLSILLLLLHFSFPSFI